MTMWKVDSGAESLSKRVGVCTVRKELFSSQEMEETEID